MNMKSLISLAKGATPADLTLADANIVNTFNAEEEEGTWPSVVRVSRE